MKERKKTSKASKEQDLAVCYADSIADNHPPRTLRRIELDRLINRYTHAQRLHIVAATPT